MQGEGGGIGGLGWRGKEVGMGVEKGNGEKKEEGAGKSKGGGGRVGEETRFLC